MEGFESSDSKKRTYLSVAGGYIWDKKAPKSNPYYKTQKYTKKTDNKEYTRSGAAFGSVTCRIKDITFRTHPTFGENVEVKIQVGNDFYYLSVGKNSRNGQDLMKAILTMDLTKSIYIKPHDFEDAETKKQVTGMSFKQDGRKLELNNIEDMPTESKEFFASGNKKKIKRFFEDLADWLEGEINETVEPELSKLNAGSSDEGKSELISNYSSATNSQAGYEDEEEDDFDPEEFEEKPKKKAAPKKKAEVKEEAPKEKKVSSIAKRKAIAAYIEENYSEQSMPKLNKEQLDEWYELVVNFEELPFEDNSEEGEANSVEDAKVTDLAEDLAGVLGEDL
ncbi:hypothetical protein [Tenacibaculum phage Larrie]|nr:hypothetical protein [Tenacibaculum phage Larrie]